MAEYWNPYQWNEQVVEWDPNAPRGSPWDVTFSQVNPGYAANLMALRDRVQSGQATPQERQQYADQESVARAIPMRDPATLQLGWSNDEIGSWDEGGSSWWNMLNGSSPDLGPVLLSIRDRMEQGTATPQERTLYQDTIAYDTDWRQRASDPRRDGAAFGLGDNLFGALGTLALGATGGLAAAPLAAGGATAATTLGSLGTLAGIGGTAAGALGQEMDIDWLRKAGLGLGAAGGIAGGLGGLANVFSTGVNSLSDAARLASNAGRVVGGVGRLSNNDILRQAGGYLGMAGQLGSGIDTMANVLGGEGVNSLTDAARLARGLGQVASVAGRVSGNRPTQQASQMLGLASTLGSLGGGVGALLGAAQGAQRGAISPPRGVPFAPVDWLRR